MSPGEVTTLGRHRRSSGKSLGLRRLLRLFQLQWHVLLAGISTCETAITDLPSCERIGSQAKAEFAVILIGCVTHHLMDTGGVEIA